MAEVRRYPEKTIKILGSFTPNQNISQNTIIAILNGNPMGLADDLTLPLPIVANALSETFKYKRGVMTYNGVNTVIYAVDSLVNGILYRFVGMPPET